MDYVALKAWLEEQIKRYEAEGKVSKVRACNLLLQELEDAETWELFLELEEQYSRTNRMLAEHEEAQQ